MRTMFEYVEEQHETFDEKHFTPADAAIFSTLANIDFSEVFPKDRNEITLGELALMQIVNKGTKIDPSEFEFLSRIYKSKRYKDLKVTDIEYEINKKEEKQFGAVTFHINDYLAYVGFSGTGSSVVGYKEDLNMAYMDIVPSQQEAVRYLNNHEDILPDDIIVGGFSKGGNLAVFASAFSSDKVKEKIIKVYNHDGPGFTDLILNEKRYKETLPLVTTYIPEASIVGLMLSHENSYNVIESSNPPIAQHIIYSWIFENDNLKIKSSLSGTSSFMARLQKQLLDKMDTKERKNSINAIFDIINEVESDDFVNLTDKDIAKEFYKSWKNSDKKTRKHVKGLVKEIGKSLFKSIEFNDKKKKKHKK